MRGVGLANALVLIAFVASVIVTPVRVLAIRVLVVGVSDLARAGLSRVVAIGTAVGRRGAHVVGVVGPGMVGAGPASWVRRRIACAKVGVARIGIAAGVGAGRIIRGTLSMRSPIIGGALNLRRPVGFREVRRILPPAQDNGGD